MRVALNCLNQVVVVKMAVAPLTWPCLVSHRFPRVLAGSQEKRHADLLQTKPEMCGRPPYTAVESRLQFSIKYTIE